MKWLLWRSFNVSDLKAWFLFFCLLGDVAHNIYSIFTYSLFECRGIVYFGVIKYVRVYGSLFYTPNFDS